MENLIANLKNDHVLLGAKINQVKNIGISSAEGKQLLISIKDDLLGHLKKEDQELYPRLYKLAETDPVIKKTVDTFTHEMELISQSALSFFDKYSHESSGMDFFKDIGRLLAALSDRIRKEEVILYPLYDEHH